MKKEKCLNRRSFVKKSLKATLLGSLFPYINRAKEIEFRSKVSDKDPTVEYRRLGRTGLMVSAVGYGAMRTRDPEVIHRAIDLGVNYIDTARIYMKGYNEVVVGKVMKSRRKEVVLATKILPDLTGEDEILKSLEESLKALQTEYVDIIQLHNLKTTDQVENESAMKALLKAKEQGKARFIGFTTHKNEIELLKKAIELNFYDVVLVKYNFKSPEELGSVIKKAADVDIGIVAMKTQAGGYKDHSMGNLSHHQAALKWVLQNPGVATAIPSMVTFGQLEEDIRVMKKKMGWQDRKILNRYGNAIDKIYCRMCNRCSDSCPEGVDVFEVNRSLMYAEGYRDIRLAKSSYSMIPSEKRPHHCLNCDSCKVVCAYGLNIKMKMERALEIFC